MVQDMFSAAGMGRFSNMFTNAGYSHPCKKSNEREKNKINKEVNVEGENKIIKEDKENYSNEFKIKDQYTQYNNTGE